MKRPPSSTLTERGQSIPMTYSESTKPQHGYEIYNKKTGDVIKTGISGQPLNKNGTSPRANSQENKLNKMAGEELYAARVVVKDVPDRNSALEWEVNNSLKLWEEENHGRIDNKL